eukprot:TRINITY_DN81015_c0_g1_i1.p1 TRINITY_DN81015_c0_g1~~TRINITY_DN81015_c0_g1_i1.p1  ORF type:complete len:587 (+),score=135.05 TRINITY_DN81015_c0_g1_i1:136-1896(+)
MNKEWLDEFYVTISPDFVVLSQEDVLERSKSGGSTGKALVIATDSTSPSFEVKNVNDILFPPTVQTPEKCYGIFGLFDGIMYAAFGRKNVSSEAYRLSDFRGIPFVPEERTDVELVRELLDALNSSASGGMYASYSLDLTLNTQQRQRGEINTEFYWNKLFMSNFVSAFPANDQEFVGRFWGVKMIRGFVKSQRLREFSELTLISRMSRKRAGTRYNVRGMDEDGHVANFTETEQIFKNRDYVCPETRKYVKEFAISFIQLRGSIPLFWDQKANIKYKPKPRLHAKPTVLETIQAARKHFKRIKQRYGDRGIICVDLVNRKGSEGMLAKGYEELVENIHDDANISYVGFDFHKHKFDLTELKKKLIPHLRAEVGAFVMQDGEVLRFQSGVFRTNCMDSLDRTNVVEGMLGRAAMDLYQKMVDPFMDDLVYRNIWADNADAVSSLYAGTGALKTDFTRTGKRTFTGKLSDGWNSTVRYWKNNFSDGMSQDALDLLTGNKDVKSLRSVERTGSGNYYFGRMFVGVFLFFLLGGLFGSGSMKTRALMIGSSFAWFGFGILLHPFFVNRPTIVCAEKYGDLGTKTSRTRK